jgi:hypothetical protein
VVGARAFLLIAICAATTSACGSTRESLPIIGATRVDPTTLVMAVACSDAPTGDVTESNDTVLVEITGSPRDGEDCGTEVTVTNGAFTALTKVTDATTGEAVPIEVDPSTRVVSISRVERTDAGLEVYGACARNVTATASIVAGELIVGLAGDPLIGDDCASSATVDNPAAATASRITEEISGRVFDIEDAPPTGGAGE